jgi:hypothetical protein
MFDNFGVSGGSMLGASPSPSPFTVDLFTYLAAATGYDYQPGKIDRSSTDYPQIAYVLVSEDRDAVLAGPNGLVNAVYQFDIYSTDPLDCDVAADQLRRALGGYRGFMGASFVKNCNVKNGRSDYQDIGDAGDDGMHRVIKEVSIWYVESNPVYP